MMNGLKELKYFTLVMLLCSFLAAGSLSSCREEKKKEDTEAQAEHPTEEADAKEEHPTDDAEEHPTEEGDEHPTEEGDEHPKDSISG